MSEEQQKKTRLLAYWCFSTTLVVFAAITAYIALWTRELGATMMEILKAGFPIWGITALAAAIIFFGYYFYTKSRS